MRRRKLLALLVGLATLFALAAVYRMSSSPRVTLQSYEQLRMGMTWNEVTDILGTPFDQTTGPTVIGDVISEFSWPPDGVRDVVRLDGNEVSLQIGRDAFGRLVGCQCRQNHRLEQGMLANLQWRLKRQWQKWFS